METQRSAEPPRGGGQWTRVAGLAISAVSLTAVGWWIIRQPAPRLPTAPEEIAALLAAIAIYGLATALRGERAYWLLERTGARPRRADAYGLLVVGQMGNTVLPLRGGDAIRIYLQAPRADTSLRNAFGAVVAERGLDAVTLLTLFVVLAYGVLHGIGAPEGTRLAATAGAAAGLAATVALALYLAQRHRRVRAAIGFLAPVAAATRSLGGKHGAAMLALTLAIWVLEAGTYLAVAGATGLEMSPLEALYLIALASLFVLIPAGPGYAGTLDAAVLFGVGAIGGSGAEAVSYLIALRFVLFAPIVLAGVALLLARYGGFGTLRRYPQAGHA